MYPTESRLQPDVKRSTPQVLKASYRLTSGWVGGVEQLGVATFACGVGSVGRWLGVAPNDDGRGDLGLLEFGQAHGVAKTPASPSRACCVAQARQHEIVSYRIDPCHGA